MKYPVLSLFVIALAGSGCFNPQVKSGGFACSGSQDGQCPTGYFCVNNLCVNNPNSVGPGVGGNGTVKLDMTQPAASAADMATHPPVKEDMAKPPVVVADMTMPVVDMATLPPDMTKVSTCAHDKCTSGKALNSSCDPCVAAVCSADSYCCTVKWDTSCVGETRMSCTASQACP